MARTHELKTWPAYFEAVMDGSKPFELRKNDRDFGVGDFLLLREYVPVPQFISDLATFSQSKHGEYTGRQIIRRVTYVLPGGRLGLDPEYVILGLEPPANEPAR